MAQVGGKRGRQVKKKREFRERVRAYCTEKGVDPFEYFVDVIADTDPLIKTEHKLVAAKELAQYMEHKLRSVEMVISPDADLDVLVALFKTLTPTQSRKAFQGAVAALNPAQTNGHAIAVPVDEEA